MNSPSPIAGYTPALLFSLILSLGVGIGLLWSFWPIPLNHKVAWDRMQSATSALIGALIGGRTIYVMINWPYFQGHMEETIQVWLGGFSWIGALVGALLAILLPARLQKKPYGYISDSLSPLFCSITISVWLASWATGYAYGKEVNSWWGLNVRDEWGTVTERWPTQLIGVISALCFHWMADYFKIRGWIKIPGLATSFELSGLALTILSLSPLQGAPMPIVYNIRLDTWASLGVLIISAILASSHYWTAKTGKQ